MPIIVSCPTCNGQLRVADDLVGRRVRCPTCHATFEAAEPAPPAPAPSAPAPAPEVPWSKGPPPPGDLDIPLETVPLRPLPDLSLDPVPPPSPPAASSPPPSSPRPRGLQGAIEVPVPGGSPLPSTPLPPSSPPPDDTGEAPGGNWRTDSRRPRLNDLHDDTRACPECGRMLHRDARRCHGCGAPQAYGDDEDDDRDRGGDDRRRYGTRRDCEPHRGGLVMTLGIIGLVLALTGCGSPLGLVLGLIAWVLGHRDLARIKRGDMDPDGEGTTQAGWICGIISTGLSALLTLSCGGLWLFLYSTSVQASKNVTRPPQMAPPPKMAPPPEKKAL